MGLPSRSTRAVSVIGPAKGRPWIITSAGPISNSSGNGPIGRRFTASGGPPPCERAITNNTPAPPSLTPSPAMTRPRIGAPLAPPAAPARSPAAGGAPPCGPIGMVARATGFSSPGTRIGRSGGGGS
jgi:hypothetical protein